VHGMRSIRQENQEDRLGCFLAPVRQPLALQLILEPPWVPLVRYSKKKSKLDKDTAITATKMAAVSADVG